MADDIVVVPIRDLSDDEALAFLRSQPDGGASLRPVDLAQRFGWPKYRVTRRLQRWEQDGPVGPRCATATATPATLQEDLTPVVAAELQPLQRPVQLLQLPATPKELRGNSAALAAVVAAPIATPIATVAASIATRLGTVDVLAYTVAGGLTSIAALFSIKGMVVIFPAEPALIVAMASMMEGAKLIGAGWLASRWRETAWIWRLVLMSLIAGLALINAAGVASQLVAAHVGPRGAAESANDAIEKSADAKIEEQRHVVADIDRRLGQIDTAIEEAAKRGRTNTALTAMEGQRKARTALVDERKREAGTLAALQAERASVAAKERQIETESAPIRYVAELIGADTDSERAIRWLIALMVLTCDPLAIALTAAVSARRRR